MAKHSRYVISKIDSISDLHYVRKTLMSQSSKDMEIAHHKEFSSDFTQILSQGNFEFFIGHLVKVKTSSRYKKYVDKQIGKGSIIDEIIYDNSFLCFKYKDHNQIYVAHKDSGDNNSKENFREIFKNIFRGEISKIGPLDLLKMIGASDSIIEMDFRATKKGKEEAQEFLKKIKDIGENGTLPIMEDHTFIDNDEYQEKDWREKSTEENHLANDKTKGLRKFIEKYIKFRNGNPSDNKSLIKYIKLEEISFTDFNRIDFICIIALYCKHFKGFILLQMPRTNYKAHVDLKLFHEDEVSFEMHVGKDSIFADDALKRINLLFEYVNSA